MTFRSLLLAATLTAALAAPALAQLPADGAGVNGVYGGSYVCTDGEHGFYLDIMKLTPRTGGGFDASGALGLFPTLAGIDGPVGSVAGSFSVAGTIAADGTVAMAPTGWLIEPEGYGGANLEGKIERRDDGLWSIKGKPVVSSAPDACSKLVATQFLP